MKLNRDNEVENIINSEVTRQEESLEMIPSESYASPQVLKALGSVLNNKYSEGYPGKRYYGGQENTDKIENLAIKRAKKLFKVDHVNVQPYSGSPANFAVLNAICSPGDKVLGMDLRFGGHLTHGWKVNATAKYFKAIQYTTDKNGYINYEEIERLAKKHKPKVIWAGATAYPRIYDFKKFSQIAKSVNAFFVADISHIAGLIIAGVHPSPVGYADIITTTTHKTLRGPRGGMILTNGKKSNPLKAPKKISKENLPTLIDRSIFPGLQGGPHEHTIAGIAVALKEADTKEFKSWAKQVVKNAKVLAKVFKENRLDLITGGTDNHLILLNVTSSGTNGKEAEEALEYIGISVNKNLVPYDKRTPFSPSGIRLGTPCATIRGMKEKEMKILGEIITETILNPKDKKTLDKNRKEIKKLCKKFPVYK